MASNSPNLPTAKNLNSSPTVSPSPSQGPSSGIDSSQRRSGGSGSFGAGATSRSSGGAPRHKQASRNQHKHSRRYRLADEDAIAESAAMRSTNSRKGQTSITHLMNFSLPPRPTYQPRNSNITRNARRNPTWGLGSGYHAADKARYVHANYRFIVDPEGDFRAQGVDADVYLDWSSIIQVLASPISQAADCPICMSEPVAPRMAKCGHIFCLHCLIRFMHSTDESAHSPEKKPRWKPCPICWNIIYITETRPLRWYIGQEQQPPREGGDIVLRLVARATGSTLAVPKDTSPSLGKDEDIPWHFAADVMDFAHVMKGTGDYMVAQYDDEIEQLEKVEHHDELMFGEDPEWTRRAIRAINDAKDRFRAIPNGPQDHQASKESMPVLSNPTGQNEESSAVFGLEEIPENWEDSTDTGAQHRRSLSPQSLSSVTADHIKVSALSSSLADLRMAQTNAPAISNYYFYHALLHYYLSSLDIRILKAAFGDFSAFPSTILPRVERVSTGHVVDDDIRKRAKYLAHLPRGCEVAFLECDWTDTVPAEVLEHFKPEIDRRRKRNHEKETREEKDRIKAEKEEYDQRYAAARRRRAGSTDNRIRPEDFQPLVACDLEEQSGEAIDTGAETMSPMWSASKNKTNGSAFASLASPSTSPSDSRTVWGTAAIAPVSPTIHSTPAPDSNPPDDGWLQGWEDQLVAGDQDVISQLEGLESATPGSASKPQGGVASGKKKKGKKITLMSTNARRGAF